MLIPHTNEFTEILSSFELSEHADVNSVTLKSGPLPSFASDSDGLREVAPIYLKYDNNSKISIDALLKKICKCLLAKGHFANDEIARTIIAFHIVIRDSKENSVQPLNEILAGILDAKCTNYMIFPFPSLPDSLEFNISDFELGRLNRDKLIYWCKKVDCDYFERYPGHFQDRYSICHPPHPIKLINLENISSKVRNKYKNIYSEICQQYFDTITQEQRHAFQYNLAIEQQVLVAAGAPFIDLDTFSLIGGSFISIYTEIGSGKNKGFFCPLGLMGGIDFANAPIRYKAKQDELLKNYNFKKLGTSELHTSIFSYCKFIVKAKEHLAKNRKDDALLNFVIALDLLLGEKDSSNQRISKRTAILCCRSLNKSYHECFELMKTIYDERSKYVHTGKAVSLGALELTDQITRDVLICLLRLSNQRGHEEAGYITQWLKNLDYLVSTLEAGRTIKDEDFVSVGVDPGL